MSRKKTKLLVCAALVSALALSGCGNSNTGTSNEDIDKIVSSRVEEALKTAQAGSAANSDTNAVNTDGNVNSEEAQTNSTNEAILNEPNDNGSENPDKAYPGMWDVLPYIDETPASNFEYHYSKNYKGIIVDGYKAQSPKVRIPDTIEGEPVVVVKLSKNRFTEIIVPDTTQELWFYDADYWNYPRDLKKLTTRVQNGTGAEAVYISPGATEIAADAFDYCKASEINIPDSVEKIGSSAFSSAENIKSITIPDSVKEIGDHAFYYCSSLKSVTMPDLLTKMGPDVFGGCRKATITYRGKQYTAQYNKFEELELAVKLDSLETAPTIISNGEFNGLDGLTSITIPDSVTEIGESAFSGTSLTSIIIPDSVYKIGGHAFQYCYELKSVTLSKNISEIEPYTFAECKSLESIIIPDSVTEIGEKAFDNCESLTSIVIPDSVRKIGENAFSSCSSLKSITLPDDVHIDLYGEVFAGCNDDLTIIYKGNKYTRDNSLESAYRFMFWG